MPELPEVESTKIQLTPLIVGQTVSSVNINFPTLRWEIPPHLITTLANQQVDDVQRRGKYLLIKFDVGYLMIHLGMSGSIMVSDSSAPLKKHDHFEIIFANNKVLRLNDPRRFGSVLFTKDGTHKLLDSLGPEPLTDDFDTKYLFNISRNKKTNIKNFIMNSKIVVGVGNIYASECLFMSKISPYSIVNELSMDSFDKLVSAIKIILSESIKAGGTTLKDFSHVDGKPGYFSQKLYVYGRAGESCDVCTTTIQKEEQSQRSTFYCPKCQKA